jgi:hypothetical protein
MPADSWKLRPGLNNVGSYQVSGTPFASGSIVAHVSGANAVRVQFPQLTKWVAIQPIPTMVAGRTLRVAFSENGLHAKGSTAPLGGYMFHISISSSLCAPLDMRVSELWFMSDDSSTYTFDVVAGLTGISTDSAQTQQRTIEGVVEAGGPNWSGSIGVG